MKTRYNILLLALMILCANCTSERKNIIETTPKEAPVITGNYVSDAYSKKDEGYDWVSVAVSQVGDQQVKISVRSRADIKKPTCTLDAVAQKMDSTTYSTTIDGQVVLFNFENDQVKIQAKNPDEGGLLYFYCSGGATIAGTYTKLKGALDQNQIDKTSFIRTLSLQDVGFNVSSIEKDGINQLTVFTFGLPHEFNETFSIENEVVLDAEVEDLNVDGSPELIVFTKNTLNNEGAIHAFSVNNKKSMSMVYFPPTIENDEINAGYGGEDEFAVVETSLVQRFPIFENGSKSGKIRQVEYTLIDGEASRKFSVKKTSEF